jgi:predicted nuclease of predicted toxin-antitoxin system
MRCVQRDTKQCTSANWDCTDCLMTRSCRKAHDEHRVVLTLDLDFGELLAISGSATPSVVLFRMRNQTPAVVSGRLLQLLRDCEKALEDGAIIIVANDSHRVRRLPIRLRHS